MTSMEEFRKLGHKVMNLYQIEMHHLKQSSELITFEPNETKPLGKNQANIYVKDENLLYRIQKIKAKKIGCMNFSNPLQPGGDFREGFNGWEETICRNSFLFPELKKYRKLYYNKNFKNPRHDYFSKSVIYANGVKILRDESESTILAEHKLIDFASVSAPSPELMRIRGYRIDEEKIKKDFYDKILRVLRMFKNTERTHIILGAFGCKKEGNNPRIVAEEFRRVILREEFRGAFVEIYFDILNDKVSLNEFKKVFESKKAFE